MFFVFGTEGFFIPPPDGECIRDDAGKLGVDFFITFEIFSFATNV